MVVPNGLVSLDDENVSVDPLFPNTPTDRSLRTDTILSISTAGQYIRKGIEDDMAWPPATEVTTDDRRVPRHSV